MKDLFDECYSGIHKQVSPKEFKQINCNACRNASCVNSVVNDNPWVERISTQVDRLLDNPHFAHPKDQAFQDIRGLQFKSAFKEAIQLEVAALKGDWSIPTESETESFLELSKRGTSPAPKNFQQSTEKTKVEPKPEKVIQTPPKPAPVHQSKFTKNALKDVPKAKNTKMPPGGIMVGGGPVPTQPQKTKPIVTDPWAIAPKPAEKIVPVGGKVVFGNKGTKK